MLRIGKENFERCLCGKPGARQIGEQNPQPWKALLLTADIVLTNRTLKQPLHRSAALVLEEKVDRSLAIKCHS